MKRPEGGYTVIEVLLVIAISTIIFVSAIAVFGGQSRTTQFSQAMQDLQSKIQSYATEVTTGAQPDMSGYYCGLSGGKPILSTTGSNTGDCIFLGRTIHVYPGSNTIKIYTVLGTRVNPASGSPALTIAEANPEAAIDNTRTPHFVDTYNLLGGAMVS